MAFHHEYLKNSRHYWRLFGGESLKSIGKQWETEVARVTEKQQEAMESNGKQGQRSQGSPIVTLSIQGGGRELEKQWKAMGSRGRKGH